MEQARRIGIGEEKTTFGKKVLQKIEEAVVEIIYANTIPVITDVHQIQDYPFVWALESSCPIFKTDWASNFMSRTNLIHKEIPKLKHGLQNVAGVYLFGFSQVLPKKKWNSTGLII